MPRRTSLADVSPVLFVLPWFRRRMSAAAAPWRLLPCPPPPPPARPTSSPPPRGIPRGVVCGAVAGRERRELSHSFADRPNVGSMEEKTKGLTDFCSGVSTRCADAILATAAVYGSDCGTRSSFTQVLSVSSLFRLASEGPMIRLASETTMLGTRIIRSSSPRSAASAPLAFFVREGMGGGCAYSSRHRHTHAVRCPGARVFGRHPLVANHSN